MKMDIVLQTDFGGDSGYAASMYGTMKLADRELKIYDLTHEIRPFDIRQASGLLRRTIPFWPAEDGICLCGRSGCGNGPPRLRGPTEKRELCRHTG